MSVTRKCTGFAYYVKNSEFVRNICISMSGTAAAQLIGFALTPVITRLFTPGDFGIFGSFNAIVGVVGAGITLEYSQAIMLPKESRDAVDLFFISCLSTAAISLFCAAACFAAPEYFLSWMGAPDEWALVLLVCATFIIGLNISFQSLSIRIKEFKQTSVSQVVRSISSNSIQIGLGLLKSGPFALIFSSVVSECIASINLLRICMTHLKEIAHTPDWLRMKQLAKDYRDFPLYSASGNLINALSQGLPVLLLTSYFDIAVAGAYAFGLKLIGAPMSLILRALRQVLFQKACETEHRGKSLLALFVQTTGALFVLAIVPSAIFIFWAPEIFSCVFGRQWIIAGEFARSLMLWQLFMFCNVPSVLFARILRLQRRLLLYDIILLGARTIVLIMGGVYLTAAQTIFLFSILGAFMNIIFISIIGVVLMKKEGAETLREMTAFALKGF